MTQRDPRGALDGSAATGCTPIQVTDRCGRSVLVADALVLV